MADIKFSEFPKATISKDSDGIAIMQDGVNKMIQSPILESKIINKTTSLLLEEGGISLNLINLIGKVLNYEDLNTITPEPNINDAYQVESDGLVYVYTENGFQENGGGFYFGNYPNGKIQKDDFRAVSGNTVFDETKEILYKDNLMNNTNKFSKTNIVNGYYIDTTTGVLEPYVNSSTTDWISVKGGSKYYLSGRDTTINNVRFRDEDNNLLKPVDSNGIEYANFNIGYQNGIIYTPNNATDIIFQLTFNGIGDIERVQFEEGEKQSLYKPYGIGTIKDVFLNDKDLEITITNDDVLLRSDFNGINNDISINFNKSISPNKLFNLNKSYLIGKNSKSDDFANGLQLNGSSDDENAPIRVNGTYIGANHGALAPLEVNVSSHNKTLADIGSTWLDDSNQVFILLRILSSTKLLVCSTNRNGAGDLWDFKSEIDAKLIYQSNGVNTATIIPLSTNRVQLYPSVKNITQKYYLDGKEIGLGFNIGENFTLSESYDVVDVPSMLDNLVNNRPSGGYTTQPSLIDGDSLLTISTNNIVSKGGSITTQCNFSVKKSLVIQYYGGIQSEFLKPSWAEEIYRIYPNSMPINGYDFRKPVEISGSYTSEMNLTSEYWEDPEFPVIRSVDTLNGVKSVNFNIGYLPVLSQENRVDQVNNAWYLYTSKKQYPHAVDNEIGNVLPSGTFRSFMCFRNWVERNPDRWNKFYVKNGKETYLFIDYRESVVDRIELPENLIDSNIELVYANSGIKLLSNVSSSFLDIDASSVTDYGNIIIKFK